MSFLKRKNSPIMSAKESFRQKVEKLLAQEKYVTKEEYEILVFEFFTGLTPAEDNYRQYVLNLPTYQMDNSRRALSNCSSIPTFVPNNPKEGGIFC